ncbi:MAG TPA: hypothetical protein VK335_23560 [Bryobacteraceae bacterium]|nr:hypothetical protein [Bryobacteraceae bacterium]
MKSALDGSGIIFLDPDNGVGEASERYALIDEVEAMTRAGRAVVVIKFPGRENHETQLAAYHTLLRRNVPVVPIVTVRTCVWLHEKKVPRFRWFTVVGADEILAERATQFVHKLNGIEKCKADLICGPQALGGKKEVINRASQPMPAQEGRLPQSAEKSRSITAANMCPECGYRFKGNGFDGIDAHWRAKHERIMPYKDAWPLVKSGKYHRPGLLLRDRPQAPALGLS